MRFNFPAVNYAEKNGIFQQAKHIASEAKEVLESVFLPNIGHTAEEVMDCLHSCETALRILEAKHGVNISKVRRDVERKNHERGYYNAD